MSDVPFKWSGQTTFSAEILKPMERVSLGLSPHGRPMSATLWRPDGRGLRIRSEMHDLAERIEVGVLCFDSVLGPSDSEQIVDLGGKFFRPFQVSKLMLNEAGHNVESGLRFQALGGPEILIVPSSYPCYLAIGGLLSLPHICEPEYPLERYQVVPVALP